MSTTPTENISTIEPERIPFWHDPAKRGIVFQVIALVLVFLLGYYIFSNTQANLRRQSIATGFGFLSREAGFEIGEPTISYSAADTYARALLVGVLNTLKVASTGIILTILLGLFVGVARLSKNWLVAKLAEATSKSFKHPRAPASFFLGRGLFTMPFLHGMVCL